MRPLHPSVLGVGCWTWQYLVGRVVAAVSSNQPRKAKCCLGEFEAERFGSCGDLTAQKATGAGSSTGMD